MLFKYIGNFFLFILIYIYVCYFFFMIKINVWVIFKLKGKKILLKKCGVYFWIKINVFVYFIVIFLYIVYMEVVDKFFLLYLFDNNIVVMLLSEK